MVVYQRTGGALNDTTGSNFSTGMTYITNASSATSTSDVFSTVGKWASNVLNIYRRTYYPPWDLATGPTATVNAGTASNLYGANLWVADDNATGGWTIADPLGNDNWVTIGNSYPRKTRAEMFRDRMRDQLLPLLRNHDGRELRAVLNPIEVEQLEQAEVVALGLLKTMVTRDQWRTYLRSGIITVRGSSGMLYVVSRGTSPVRVLSPQGRPVASLCVYVPSGQKLPPSDQVIARLVLINCEEPEIWQRANVSGACLRGSYEAHGYPWTPEILRGILVGKEPPSRSLLAAA